MLDFTANSQPDGSGDRQDCPGLGRSLHQLRRRLLRHLPQRRYRTGLIRPSSRACGQAVRRSNDERRIEVSALAPLVSGQVLRDEFAFNDEAETIAAFANWRAETLSIDQPRPTVALLASSDAEIAVILGADVEKRVHLTDIGGLYPSALRFDLSVMKES